jgi:hypothetical protein
MAAQNKTQPKDLRNECDKAVSPLVTKLKLAEEIVSHKGNMGNKYFFGYVRFVIQNQLPVLLFRQLGSPQPGQFCIAKLHSPDWSGL